MARRALDHRDARHEAGRGRANPDRRPLRARRRVAEPPGPLVAAGTPARSATSARPGPPTPSRNISSTRRSSVPGRSKRWTGRSPDGYTARVQATMVKAAREAKRNTTWTDPDPSYAEALRHFVAERPRRPGRPAVPGRFPPLRPQDRPDRRGPLAGPGRLEAGLARGRRHLPGLGALGPEPRRPR